MRLLHVIALLILSSCSVNLFSSQIIGQWEFEMEIAERNNGSYDTTFYKDGFASIHFEEEGRTVVRVNTVKRTTAYSTSDSILNIGNKEYKIVYLDEHKLRLLNVKDQKWPTIYYYSRIHSITNQE